MDTETVYVEWNMPHIKTSGVLGSLETVQAVVKTLGESVDDGALLVKMKQGLQEHRELVPWLQWLWTVTPDLYVGERPPAPWRVYKVGSEPRLQKRFLDLLASDLVVHGMAVAFAVLDDHTVAGFIIEDRDDQSASLCIYDASGYAIRHRAFIVLLVSGLFGEDMSVEEAVGLLREKQVEWK